MIHQSNLNFEELEKAILAPSADEYIRNRKCYIRHCKNKANLYYSSANKNIYARCSDCAVLISYNLIQLSIQDEIVLFQFIKNIILFPDNNGEKVK